MADMSKLTKAEKNALWLKEPKSIEAALKSARGE